MPADLDGTLQQDEGSLVVLLLHVVHSEVVDHYENLFHRAGLNQVHLCPPSQARLLASSVLGQI